MIPAQPTPDEARRLEALGKYAILDTLPEQALDDLTALAAQICEMPVAMISLVDENRQWFKSKVGIDATETARDISFCGHAVQQRELFIVPDATVDERFVDNPLVTGAPSIRFYAGAPLVSPRDAALGALCVIDHVPRTLTEAQKQALRVLARQVMTHLELHRHTRELAESEERVRIVTDNARVGLVILNQDRTYTYANKAYAEILGLPLSDIIGRRVPDVLPDVYEEVIRPSLDRALNGERVSYEIGAGGDSYYEVRYEPAQTDGAVEFVVAVINDISERKRAEMVSLRLAAIVEFSDDAIIGKDLSGIVSSWNAGAEKVFGYTAEEIVGTSITRLIPPERQAEEGEILRRIKNDETVKHFETVRTRKDGRQIDISVTVSPIKDGTGQVVGASKVARDITERKQAEAALRDGEAKFRTLFNEANDGIFMLHNGIFVDCNAKGLELFGVTRNQLIGQSPAHFSPPSQPDGRNSEEKSREIIQGALAGEPQSFEWVHHRLDDSPVDAEVSLNRLELGGEIYVQSIVRDITERKRAQEQIAEQAALLDKAQDAIVALDLERKVIFWNRGAEHLYGWKRDEVLGRNVSNLFYEDPKQFEEINSLTIREGEWSGELVHLTKDRREVVVQSRRTLIRDNEGRPKSFLVINTDITEKKKIEAQFMRAQRMESIGTLAGGIAHDLNNILAPIMMSIDVLKTVSDKPLAKQILETIEVSAKRGADIVRQVLSFARGLEGERIEVQPKHLLKDLENIIKDTFPKDIRLHFSIPNDTWTILGDPTQVHQILLNLCVNARDAMPNGGTLTVGVENCELDEQYAAMNIQAKPGRYVNISVTDTGTGMPPAIIEKIFEPFFTTKALNKGTGLGLSTVMAIVKSHEGIINVYSELGKGTTFKVYLPAMETSTEGRKEQSEQVSLPRGNGETILVVDDEASLLTITSQTLQAFGYRVLTASDGADAVAVYAQHKDEIAVVLTDMAMPVMDGPATIHALMRINPKVKIVAASGLNANGSVAKVASAGVKHFLTKPYTAGTLLKTLRAIMDEA